MSSTVDHVSFVPAGDGISEMVSNSMPPSLVLLVRSKSLIVTPGRLLNALREIFLLKFTPSKFVPSAVTRRLDVDMVHSKLGL